jgi:hypothetical protein
MEHFNTCLFILTSLALAVPKTKPSEQLSISHYSFRLLFRESLLSWIYIPSPLLLRDPMSHPKQSMARQGVHGFALARLVLEVFREHCSYQTTASCASEIGNRVAAQLVRHEHESPFFVDPTISEFLEGFASILMSPATCECPSIRTRIQATTRTNVSKTPPNSRPLKIFVAPPKQRRLLQIQ